MLLPQARANTAPCCNAPPLVPVLVVDAEEAAEAAEDDDEEEEEEEEEEEGHAFAWTHPQLKLEWWSLSPAVAGLGNLKMMRGTGCNATTNVSVWELNEIMEQTSWG